MRRISNRRLLLQLSHYMGAVSMFCLYCVAGEKVVSVGNRGFLGDNDRVAVA